MFIVVLFLILFVNMSVARGEMVSLNPMQEFSGLSKAEVLDLRKAAVENSIVFGEDLYEPDKRVFQIENGRPWISAYEITCFGVDGTEDIGRGASRESVGILNPELLYYINMPSYDFHSKTGCSEADYLIPNQVFYDEGMNTITVYIDYSSFLKKNKWFYEIDLSDANARDLGYNYGLADESKNIRFKEAVNLSNSITKTRGFYHKGYSCKASGGCNNYSPYEPRYGFYLTKLPATIHIKLWKKAPSAADQEADINYEMIFN